MSYLAHHKDFANVSQATRVETKPGFWRRVFNAMVDARQRQADRQIAYYLRQSGGRLTDDIERKVARDLGCVGFGSRC